MEEEGWGDFSEGRGGEEGQKEEVMEERKDKQEGREDKQEHCLWEDKREMWSLP